MEIRRPAFVPDPTLARAEMESLQHDIASAATTVDDLAFDPATVCSGSATSETAPTQTTLDGDSPVVAGVDQAFRGDELTSSPP